MATRTVTYRVSYNAHRYEDCSDSVLSRTARFKIPATDAAQYPTDHASAIMAQVERWRRETNEAQCDKPLRLRRYVGIVHWRTAEPISKGHQPRTYGCSWVEPTDEPDPIADADLCYPEPCAGVS